MLQTRSLLHFLPIVFGLLTAANAQALDEPAAWADANQLKHDVTFLASPQCEGRGTGTPGIARAEEYIARELGRQGVFPAGENGTWFQTFEVVTGVDISPATTLTIATGTVPTHEQWAPLALSGNGMARNAQLVFAGYGITAPQMKYDDYEGIDVKGKIVLVLAHDPRELDKRSPFRSPLAFRYTEARYKAINAREHGAAALLIVNDAWRHKKEDDAPIKFDGGHAVSAAGLPVGSITAKLANELLKPLGLTVEKLGRRIDGNLKPSSLAIPGVTATLSVGLLQVKGKARNVIGLMPGRDPALRTEVVVVGAHHDHLGRGGVYSLQPSAAEIHPGADDNASGVAGVLALARRFGKVPVKPKRSILFATFSAEELGLLGSAHYVKNPPVTLTNTIAMINMDMIGRLREDKVHVQGVETAREFRAIVERATKAFGLKPSYAGDGYGPSDQTSFYAKDRPVLFFFTGPHTEYHRPGDTADKVEYQGQSRVLRTVSRVVEDLAETVTKLTFVKSTTPPPSKDKAAGGRGYGPYFGSIPDFSEFKGGVLLSGVRPGSPAEKAGVKGGDAIVKFGGVSVNNLEDFTYALQTHRPDDEVEVELMRGGKRMKVKAVLEKRK